MGRVQRSDHLGPSGWRWCVLAKDLFDPEGSTRPAGSDVADGHERCGDSLHARRDNADGVEPERAERRDGDGPSEFLAEGKGLCGRSLPWCDGQAVVFDQRTSHDRSGGVDESGEGVEPVGRCDREFRRERPTAEAFPRRRFLRVTGTSSSQLTTPQCCGESGCRAETPTNRRRTSTLVFICTTGTRTRSRSKAPRYRSPFVVGDVFRIGVEGGVVKYRKNGVLFHTNVIAPSYPLLVDTSIYYAGTGFKGGRSPP